MNLYIASDHAGFPLKEAVLITLKDKYEHLSIIDVGAQELVEGDNYPEYMANAARSVSEDAEKNPSFAVLFGGSGQGEAIVANRFRHVRAIVYAGGNLELVRLGRDHNDANILSIGARFVEADDALKAIDLFLNTPFSHHERHAERVVQIEEVCK